MNLKYLRNRFPAFKAFHVAHLQSSTRYFLNFNVFAFVPSFFFFLISYKNIPLAFFYSVSHHSLCLTLSMIGLVKWWSCNNIGQLWVHLLKKVTWGQIFIEIRECWSINVFFSQNYVKCHYYFLSVDTVKDSHSDLIARSDIFRARF